MQEGSSIGPYRLLRELGRGGTATVYEAVDERDGRIVALKALAPQVARATSGDDAGALNAGDITATAPEEVAERLEHEANAIARLDHPNVTRILDFGAAPPTDRDGRTEDASPVHYLVMERVYGETLRDRLRREGALTPAAAADILDPVAAGLDAVHAAGVVHRDIKPSNILLVPDGTVKITDFGIARRREDALVTRDGLMVGSPVYMSPEQVLNLPATEASDLWSLGVVLYEMLAGHPPFTADSIPATLFEIAHGGAPDIPAGLPQPIRDVLTRALSRNPALRFSDAASLAAEFRAALRQQTTEGALPLTRREPAAPTAVRSARRRESSVAAFAAAAGAALLLLGLALGTLAGRQDRAPEAPGAQESPRLVRFTRALPASGEHKAPVTTAAAAVKKPSAPPRPATLPSPVSPAPIPPRVALALPATPAPAEGMTVVEKPSPRPRANAPRPAAATAPPPSPPLVGFVEPATPAARSAAAMTPAPAAPTPPLPSGTPTDAAPAPPPASETPSPPLPAAPPSDAAASGDSQGVPATDPLTLLSGLWSGTYGGNPATLHVEQVDTDTGKFQGVLRLQTPDGTVRLAVSGIAFDDGGITLRETQTLEAPARLNWKAGGVNAGTFDESALLLKGTGRSGGNGGPGYSWEFHR